MSYLKQPLNQGSLPLKNRLVMPPMATLKAEINGSVSRELLDFYDEKTRGGYIGLVIIEHSFISQQGKANEKQISVAHNDMIEPLKKLAALIQKNGSKAVIQLNHTGSAARSEVTGMEPVGPSAICNPPGGGVVPKELDTIGIKAIVEQFKDAALRVKRAGFDGVELHAAHGYLLSQFLSPLTNKRTDEYGGDITGRMKLHLEIIRAIREAVGKSFPILLRLGASDYMEGGLTIQDSKIAAQAFERAGLDILDVSGGFCRYTIPGIMKPGYFTELTKVLKEVVTIPVIVTGGIIEPESAENILREGSADLIGVGRAILKDSAWAKRAME